MKQNDRQDKFKNIKQRKMQFNAFGYPSMTDLKEKPEITNEFTDKISKLIRDTLKQCSKQ